MMTEVSRIPDAAKTDDTATMSGAAEAPEVSGVTRGGFLERFPFYPFVLGTYPILFLAAHNGFPLGRDVLTFLGGSLIAVLLLFFALNVFVKNARKSAIVVASWVLLFFWSYPLLHGLRWICPFWLGNDFILVFFALYPVLTFVFLRYRGDYSATTRFLNIVSTTLLLLLVFSGGKTFFEFTAKKQRAETVIQARQENGPPGSPSTEKRNDDVQESGFLSGDGETERPDVYIVLLDAYVGETGLREVYDFDNTEFLDYLRDKKFSVAENSLSNYTVTMFSLPSFFDMQYHDEKFAAEFHDEFGRGGDWFVAARVTGSPFLRRFLENGYETTFLSPPYLAGNEADLGIDCVQIESYDPEFASILWGSTLLRYFAPFPGVNELWRKEILETLGHLDAMAATPSENPRFVFTYIFSPHSPFIFQADGSPQTPYWEGLLSDDRKKTYCVEQHRYINTRIRNWVETLLASERKAIIIIFSDHAARNLRGGATVWDQSREGILDSFSNLLAVYTPDEKTDLFPEGVSLINALRIVDNHLLGRNEPLLPSHHFALRDGRCRDITEAVRQVLETPEHKKEEPGE